jgi:predicted nuclease of predicted toxin-antitoxin system
MDANRSRSKRRSDTSALPNVPLFLDRALDFDSLYDALTKAGATVLRHRDYFKDDAPDPEWLPVVGHQGWIVLTKDKAIQHSEIEKAAIRNARVSVFILVRSDLSGQEMSSIFVKALPAISNVVRRHRPPFIAKVYRDASVLKTNIV